MFNGFLVNCLNKPFSVQENWQPIVAFRKYSKECYPLNVFFNQEKPGDVENLHKETSNVTLMPTRPITSSHDFSRFMILECFQRLQGEYLVNFHAPDAYFLNRGWEDFLLEGQYDYIGAPWDYLPTKLHVREYVNHSQYPKLKNGRLAGDLRTNTLVGNGGFSFRRRSKILEVLAAVDLKDYQRKWEEGTIMAEDCFYSFYGFALNIFRPVSVDEAKRWSQEPYKDGSSFGFHQRRPQQHIPLS